MQAAVEDTWAAFATLQFEGWDQCETSGSALKIRLNTVFTGASADGSADVGMEARRTPGNASATFWIPSNPNTNRLRYLAVHEFGHILGFSHEQDSPDNWNLETNEPIDCDQTGAPSEDGVQISAYDANSIMNYCGNHLNSVGTLSAGDVKAIQQVYGPESANNLTAIRSATGDLHVFAANSGTLDWYGPSNVWASLGVSVVGTPAALAMGGSSIHVFYRQTNGHLLTKSYFAGTWSASTDLGGSFPTDVAAVSWGSGRIDLFGSDATSGEIVSKSMVNGSWTSTWVGMGGALIGKVAAVSRGSNSIDLFVHGTDGALYRNSYGGWSWTGWTQVATGMNGQPVVTTSSTGLEVVAIDATNGSVKHKRWESSTNTWTPSSTSWNTLSGAGTTVPALVPQSNGNVRLYVRGQNLQLYGRTLTASSGSWSAWESLGGIILSSPRAEQNGIAVWARGSNEEANVWATYWNSIGGVVSW